MKVSCTGPVRQQYYDEPLGPDISILVPDYGRQNSQFAAHWRWRDTMRALSIATQAAQHLRHIRHPIGSFNKH